MDDSLYELVLEDLLAQRDRIDRAIAAIRAVRSPDPTFTPVHPDAFVGKTIVEAAIDVLGAAGRPLRSRDIAEALKVSGMRTRAANLGNTVGGLMLRRERDVGDVVRVGRGTWAKR